MKGTYCNVHVTRGKCKHRIYRRAGKVVPCKPYLPENVTHEFRSQASKHKARCCGTCLKWQCWCWGGSHELTVPDWLAGELQIEWETLPQKIRCKVIELNSYYQLLTSCAPKHVHCMQRKRKRINEEKEQKALHKYELSSTLKKVNFQTEK